MVWGLYHRRAAARGYAAHRKQVQDMSEKNVLHVSIWGTTAFALFGVVWGVVADSGMIIFDGIYSLISVGLSFLSLVVLKQIKATQEDDRFPFGKAHFEPLLVVFKSLTLIGMCAFSAANAFSDVLAGGRHVSPGPAVLYAFLSTSACLVISLFIQKKNRSLDSSLLHVERNQWFGDFLLSFGVLIGFSTALVLQGTRFDWLIPYADPGMVMLASGFFILLPLKNLVTAGKEVLYYRTDSEWLAPIRDEVDSVAREMEASEHKLRMLVIGREISIEVNFLLSDQSVRVGDMDAIRHRIKEVVGTLEKQCWININFTMEKAWL